MKNFLNLGISERKCTKSPSKLSRRVNKSPMKLKTFSVKPRDTNEEIAYDYYDVWRFLVACKPFRLSINWGRIFSVQEFMKITKQQLYYEDFKKICEVCSKSSIEEFYFLSDRINSQTIKGWFNCVADLIRESSSIKNFSLCGNYPFSLEEATNIGKAIESNSSIQIFDTYTRKILPYPSFAPILNSIKNNSSIRILSFPNLELTNNDGANQFQSLIELIDPQKSKCALQVLDLLAFSQKLNSKQLCQICEALEKNKSIHTLAINSPSIKKKTDFLRELEKVLRNNISLQYLFTTANFSDDDFVPNGILFEIREKLIRNKKFSKMKREFEKFLLLTGITNNFAKNSNSCCFNIFPSELRVIIYCYFVELQVLDISKDSYIRTLENGKHPFTFSDIY